MSDPIADKTLSDIVAEFRAMKADALVQQNFEVAFACEQFARAADKAIVSLEAKNACLRRVAAELRGSVKWSDDEDAARLMNGVLADVGTALNS